MTLDWRLFGAIASEPPRFSSEEELGTLTTSGVDPGDEGRAMRAEASLTEVDDSAVISEESIGADMVKVKGILGRN